MRRRAWLGLVAGLPLLLACQSSSDPGRLPASENPAPQPSTQNRREDSLNEETSPTIVALVWMRSASREEGAGVDSPADPSQAEKVADFFREAGFEVSPAQSGQFSIVGPKERFESTFGETIEVETEDGEVRRVSRGDGELVLSLERLPQEVRSGIHVVTFDEPLDFGPSSY